MMIAADSINTPGNTPPKNNTSAINANAAESTQNTILKPIFKAIPPS